MQKSTKVSLIISILLIIISFIIGIYVYPSMPDMMASHWNISGQVNGYMSKFWGLFLLPFVSLALLVFLFLIPYLDPRKKNIDKFRKTFDIFIVVLMLFMFFLYLVTIFWNSGIKFDMTTFVFVAFCVLMFFIGFLLKNAKPNWFIGIRTPWTLSSDKIWKKTHDLGAVLFMVFAFVSLLGLLFIKYALFFVLVPLIGISVFLVVYSFVLYKIE